MKGRMYFFQMLFGVFPFFWWPGWSLKKSKTVVLEGLNSQQEARVYEEPRWKQRSWRSGCLSTSVCQSLLFPLLATIQAHNEDSHGLICRPRLQLIIGALALSAPIALVLVRRAPLVPLQNLLFPNKLPICHLLPVFGKHFICRHRRNCRQGKLALLAPR